MTSFFLPLLGFCYGSKKYHGRKHFEQQMYYKKMPEMLHTTLLLSSLKYNNTNFKEHPYIIKE
jgi:hypothetical protein